MDESECDERRKERLVKNELAMRDYNDRRVAIEQHAVIEAPAPWVCECGDADCVQALEATVDEFQAAHNAPNRFIVKPGHVYLEVERVVAQNDRYWIVEKYEGEMRRVTT